MSIVCQPPAPFMYYTLHIDLCIWITAQDKRRNQLNPVPDIRIKRGNNKDTNPEGDFILYWMIANRRLKWNYSLDRAIEWAEKLIKPVVVLEALNCDYEWASDRFHGFIIEGMRENCKEARGRNILYYPYIEPVAGRGRGLVRALAEHSCVIVTDDYPAFFIPDMLKKISEKLPVLIELADSNGILPMDASQREFTTAYSFRRFLQKSLPRHLMDRPREFPLEDLYLKKLRTLPEEIKEKWPPAAAGFLKNYKKDLKNLPMDHNVKIAENSGGYSEGRKLLDLFINEKLPAYTENRNLPEEDATSNLSSYLHFGHISAHEILYRILIAERWYPGRLGGKTDGKREGWWGMSRSAEAFLDQLITWRELGFNMCRLNPDYDKYKTLPTWAKETLRVHGPDEREYIYSMEEYENASTHDPLWNAAQVQLIGEGKIHNYLRMLWGKKILEWSRTPKEALKIMIHLNNKYALDGRDPNSYSGIFWVMGRYDRAWGPERRIFGKVRYMSSKNTAKKVKTSGYIEKYTRAIN